MYQRGLNFFGRLTKLERKVWTIERASIAVIVKQFLEYFFEPATSIRQFILLLDKFNVVKHRKLTIHGLKLIHVKTATNLNQCVQFLLSLA